MKFSNGSVFGNRYILGDRIAVGGMGEVWKATDQVLGRVVAIKLLSPSLADQPGFTARFREEARNTAVLAHANIAAVYDYGEDDGASWLVMELVEGRPLSQIIKEDGPLPPRQVAHIMGQAASALQAAHDAGVVHRDVKPANILVRRDGQVKLTDFGIARAVDAAPITRTGEVMGTAQYISPEQAMGRKVGPQSDIYALGVVAHEMLTGQRPFDEGSPVATAMAHIHNAPPPLPASVPEPLAGVIMASLKKDPEERPESAAAVASALAGGPEAQRFVGTQVLGSAAPTQAMTRRQGPPPPTPTGGHRLSDPDEEEQRRSPLLWLVPLLLVLLALAGYLLAQSGLFGGGASTPTPSTTLPATSPAPSTSEPTTEPSTSSTTSSSTTSAAQTVQVNPGDYIGRTVGDARAALEALGLQVSINEVASDAPAGRVTGVNPSGARTKGSVVTLTVSTGPASAPTQGSTRSTTTPPAPTATQAPTGGGGSTGGGEQPGGGGGGANGAPGGDGGSGSGDQGGSSGGTAAEAGSNATQGVGVSSGGMSGADSAAMGDGR